MANDFNASLVISTSEAVTNVRNVDAAAKDLDKTLAHLHTTMQSSQGDIDKVAKSLKVFTDTQRQANRDAKDRNATLISQAKLEREQIVNKDKSAQATQRQAQNEAKLAGIRARNGRDSASGLGNETRRNAESANRIAASSVLTTARLTTEAERRAAAEQRTGAALAQRAGAEARAEQASLRLAAAQERNRNANLALNDSLSNSRYLLYDVGATYATLSAILLAIPAATTAVAASYEKDFTQVLRTTGLVGDQAGELFQELKALGREIPLSFGEFANIATIAGQLGIAKDELGAFTETVAKFGAASNVGISDAATAFGRLENSFNQSGDIPDFFNKVGSAIAKVGVESAASETEIIAVTNQISAAGAQFGFTADQIVGLSGALASVRIRPELARGAFQRIMLNLSRAADEGAGSFDRFAKYTSVAGDAAIDLFKTDPSSFFQQYIAGIKGTISAGTSVSAVLDDIGAKNVFDKQFILGLANGLTVYNKAMSDSSGAFEKGSFLNESTKATFETFAATLTKISTAFSSLGASLGGGSLAPLTAMAETVLNITTSFDRLISQSPAIGALINSLLALGGVVGVFLAFKSAQAFVLAGLVGLQQVMGKASIAGALSLRGNVSELAKTMLMAKGASAQYAASLLANKTAMQQLGIAATTTGAQIRAGAAGSIGVLAPVATTATGRLAGLTTGLRATASAMLGLVGGPLGAITIGLGALVATLISTEEQANQAGDAIARAFKNGGEAGTRAIAENLVDRKVGFLDNIAAGNVGKSIADLAKEVDVSFDSIVSAVGKGEDAAKSFQTILNQLGQKRGGANYSDALSKGLISGDEDKKLQFLLDNVVDLGHKSAKSANDVKATDDAVKNLSTSANAAAPNAEGLAEGVGAVGDKAEDTASKIGDAVDAIFGLMDAGLATQNSLGSLGESIQKSTSLNSTDAGGRDNLSNIQDVLRNAALEQQQLIDSGQQTAQQAAANYTTFIDGLLQQLASKGLDVSQVQALANQAKGVFGATLAEGAQPTVQVKVDASKVDAAKAYLDSVVATYGTTNLDIILETTGDEQTAQNIFDMQQYVEEATGQKYTVDVESDTYKANQGIHDTVEWAYSVLGVPFTATVEADVDPATQALQFLAQYAATVVNGIIDGINSVRTPVNSFLGQNVDPIGHVGWGEMPEAPKAAVRAVPTIPRAPAPPSGNRKAEVAQNNENASSLDGLSNAYDDAAAAAEKAGEKGKKAGEDAANGIDEATRAAEDYANRLRQGLQSAFDKQYAMVTAADAYHSALNSINKKREDELSQIKDLIAKQRELNNSRKEDLVTARKAGIEKAISQKYGEVDRAADYGQQEQTALDSAAAKQKDIEATKKQADEIQAGIGKLDGYSQAAIDNRAALRDLESKMLDMISAYAATGKTQEQVRAYAARLTGQFRNDVVQLGFNRTAVANLQGNLSRYIGVVNAVPRTKATKVTADTGQAQSAIGQVQRALGGLRNKNIEVKVNYRGTVFETVRTTKAGDKIYGVTDPNTGRANGTYLFNRGGQVPGYASGGLIPGKSPSDPRVDNLMASVDGKGQVMVRSGEFIVQQPAVDYWGLDFFKQLNNMKMPAFNAGGQIGGGRGSGSATNGPVLVELTAENIAAIQRMPPIALYADSTKIAEASNHGNMILATQGAN